MTLVTQPFQIHLLLCESSPKDVSLLRESLQRDKLSRFYVAQAARLSEALELLAKSRCDLVLLNLNLPDSRGLATFDALHRRFPQVPVIILSESIDEQEAFQSVRAGAQDYLVKSLGGFDIAARTVRNAIERKKLGRRLLESEKRFSNVFHASPSAQIIAAVKTDRILDVNEACCRLVGYARDEIIGLNTVELGFWESPADRQSVLLRLAQDGFVRDLEMTFRSRSGEARTLLVSIEQISIKEIECSILTALDITERNQAELALRTSEERFRGLVDSLDSMVATLSAEGRFLYVNDVLARRFGGSAASWAGRPLSEFLADPAASQALHERIQRVIQSDLGDTCELSLPQGGRLHWYRTAIQPIHDECGRVIHVLINLTDITDLKQMQHDLLELNRTLEARVRQRSAEVQDLYDNAPCGYHSLDAAGRLTSINQTELSWLGCEPPELLGRPFSSLLLPAQRQSFEAQLALLARKGWASGLEYDLQRKDGSVLPVTLNATAVYDAQGRCTGSRSSLFDNTEGKKAAQALRESEETYRALFESANDAIFLLSPTGDYLRANSRCEDLLGYTVEEMLGRSTAEFLLPSELPDARDRFARLLAGQHVPPYERLFQRKDGVLIETEINLSLLRDEHGRPKLVQSVVRDITQRKKAEAALRRANHEMEQAMRVKDEFLASMSHELRTPLTGILGLTEVMQTEVYGPLNEMQAGAVRIIEESGRHLLNLINDILDLSKIEAGKFEINPMEFNVGELCQASLRLVSQMAAAKRQTLDFSCRPAGLVLRADPRRLKQILVNLLSNAVKFTPEGGQIGLEVQADQHQKRVSFCVWDNGIGIAHEHLPRLFKPFVQLDSSLERSYSGTGLGLTLVQRLAELHGGSVAVESSPGQGSRFTISLPWEPEAAPAGDPALPAAAAPDLPTHQRILLVEDNDTTVVVFSEFLKLKGFTIDVARTGTEALERFSEFHPQLILMDIQLPGLSGLDAIRRIRSLPPPESGPVKIIALTALVMPGDRDRCLEAGANAYLSKPVSLRALAAAIQELSQPAGKDHPLEL